MVARKTGRRAVARADVTSMKWSNNNKACVALWGALLVLDQNRKAFAGSGAVKIGSFPFWVPGETGALRDRRARSFGRQLHNIFIGFNGAEIERGSSKAKALDALTAILKNDDATLAQLADVVDDHYHFKGEVNV